MGGNFWIAIGLTAAAGASTLIGSVIGFAVKKPGKKFMGFSLGFSAGVMVYVSFVELLGTAASEDYIGFVPANIAFFIGMAAFMALDWAVPHEYIGQHDHGGKKTARPLMRTGTLLALGIGLHNFPEGMVTFAGAMKDPKIGVALAFAIAIHNIPEGLAISAPVYAATGSRKKAFLWSGLSGASEPVGALVAGAILLPFLNDTVLGWSLAVVAGIMVAISLDELIPAAKEYGEEHMPIVGVLAGMVVMMISLELFR